MKCVFIQQSFTGSGALLLYVTPQRLAKYLHVCIYWVCVSEREVYLCLLKGVRVSTASHLTSLCSRFVRASACQAVFVCACVSVGVCERTCACLWLREGEKLPSASVSLTTQGNGGSQKFTALCHQCCKVCFERCSSQSQRWLWKWANLRKLITNIKAAWGNVPCQCKGRDSCSNKKIWRVYTLTGRHVRAKKNQYVLSHSHK